MGHPLEMSPLFCPAVSPRASGSATRCSLAPIQPRLIPQSVERCRLIVAAGGDEHLSTLIKLGHSQAAVVARQDKSRSVPKKFVRGRCEE